MPFRKLLIWIRDKFYQQRRELFLYTAAAVLLSAGLGFLADFLLPWAQWAIFVRAIVALPSAASLFVLGYSLTLLYVGNRARRVENYRSWRVRLSPTMRQRASAVVGAILFVCMFAVTLKPGYTLVSSIIIAIVAGLFAFMRRTSQEIARDDIGLPDARDVALDTHLRETSRAALQRKKSKEKASEKEKNRKLEQELEQS